MKSGSKRAKSKRVTPFHRYLPLSEEVFGTGLYVTSGGLDIARPGEPYPAVPHPSLYHFSWSEGRTLPEFCVMLLTRGTGEFESRPTKRLPLRPGMAVILFPDIWHRYRPHPNVGWTLKWVQFNGEFAHRLLDDGMLRPENAVLRPRDPALLERMLDRLLLQMRSEEPEPPLIAPLKLYGALSVLLDDVPTLPAAPRAAGRETTSADHGPLVAAALDFIWTRSHHTLEVPMVAAALQVTRRTLERHFRRFHSRSVLEEIVECRFNRAMRLLSETHLPIKRITALAGFGSAENMRYVFRQRVGLSPEKYRATFRAPGRKTPPRKRGARRTASALKPR